MYICPFYVLLKDAHTIQAKAKVLSLLTSSAVIDRLFLHYKTTKLYSTPTLQ